MKAILALALLLPSLASALELAYDCKTKDSAIEVRVFYRDMILDHVDLMSAAPVGSLSTQLMGLNGVVAGFANPTIDLYGAPPRTDFRLLGSGKIADGAQDATLSLRSQGHALSFRVSCRGLGW